MPDWKTYGNSPCVIAAFDGYGELILSSKDINRVYVDPVDDEILDMTRLDDAVRIAFVYFVDTVHPARLTITKEGTGFIDYDYLKGFSIREHGADQLDFVQLNSLEESIKHANYLCDAVVPRFTKSAVEKQQETARKLSKEVGRLEKKIEKLVDELKEKDRALEQYLGKAQGLEHELGDMAPMEEFEEAASREVEDDLGHVGFAKKFEEAARNDLLGRYAMKADSGYQVFTSYLPPEWVWNVSKDGMCSIANVSGEESVFFEMDLSKAANIEEALNAGEKRVSEMLGVNYSDDTAGERNLDENRVVVPGARKEVEETSIRTDVSKGRATGAAVNTKLDVSATRSRSA